MNNHYLIEVKRVQKLYLSIDAKSPKQAIEKASNQNCNLAKAMLPEVEAITAKCIGGD
jgi:hypothetical protein